MKTLLNNMFKIFCFSLLFLFHLSYSQVTNRVIDKESKLPIPYVNIWMQNRSLGTTANEEGKFTLKCTETDSIVFSAVGYEKLKIKSSDIIASVELVPEISILDEVIVRKKSRSELKMVGNFKKNEIDYGYSCTYNNPWMIAKFFPYEKNFTKTPFINKIKIALESTIDNAKFNLRLYMADENGVPSDLVIDENLITLCKKNSQIIEIDISKFNISFPQNGIFVALEWLIITENITTTTMTDPETKTKSILEFCEPSLKGIKDSVAKTIWKYNKGEWNLIIPGNNLFNVPAIALGLSN